MFRRSGEGGKGRYARQAATATVGNRLTRDQVRTVMPYAVMLVLVVITAGVGMIATDIGEWYRQLNKPGWQPPDWVFGPAWTTIFLCLVIAVGMAWNVADDAGRRLLTWAVPINLLLNMLWSVLFFYYRRPDWALVEVVFLWISIAHLLSVLYAIHATSAWLLVPYLLWVSFAAWLTFVIVRLNPVERLS